MNYRLKTMEEMDACVFSSDMLYNDEERKHFEAMVARWVRALSETENTAPPQQPEQEPYCYTWDVWISGGYWEARYGWEPYCGGKRPDHSTEAKPLYTTPPQREWQGLTDEERRKVWNAPENLERPMDFARAIEAKLKEKNT